MTNGFNLDPISSTKPSSIGAAAVPTTSCPRTGTSWTPPAPRTSFSPENLSPSSIRYKTWSALESWLRWWDPITSDHLRELFFLWVKMADLWRGELIGRFSSISLGYDPLKIFKEFLLLRNLCFLICWKWSHGFKQPIRMPEFQPRVDYDENNLVGLGASLTNPLL